jgi:hypothetical protein
MKSGFRVEASERFDIGITLDPEFYADYLMTEVNVTCAVRAGEPAGAIRAWCEGTLRGVFGGRAREVMFPGYIAWMVPQA